MGDPRIQRTRSHVLSIARRLLSEPQSGPLTFTLLASEAQVSRRTLYTHWGSIDGVISEAVSYVFAEDDTDLSELTLEGRVNEFLLLVRNRMAEPMTSVAIAGMIAKATHDPDAALSLSSMSERGREEFSEHVAPITIEQYELIVGPIFHAEYIARATMTDQQVERLAHLALGVLAPLSQD